MDRLSFKVQLRLLPKERGGRRGPIATNYCPNWDLGSTWLGQPSLDDARVMLDGIAELAPGEEDSAILEPLLEDFWGNVAVGAVLPMQEGNRIMGYATVTEVVRPAHFTRATAAFAACAREYCAYVEQASTFDLPERLAMARTLLLELYRLGCLLPHVEPPAGVDAGPSRERPANWPGFGRFDIYWEMFDPYDHEDEEPVAGDLNDDVLDVYFDVGRGLDLWNSRAPRAAAIWEWRFHFDIHWGDHAVDALRALHRSCPAARESAENDEPKLPKP